MYSNANLIILFISKISCYFYYILFLIFRKEHLKALEEVYSKFTQYVTRVQKDTT